MKKALEKACEHITLECDTAECPLFEQCNLLDIPENCNDDDCIKMLKKYFIQKAKEE